MQPQQWKPGKESKARKNILKGSTWSWCIGSWVVVERETLRGFRERRSGSAPSGVNWVFFPSKLGGGRKVFNLLILYWPWFFFSPYILSFICTVVIWNSWLASYLEIWFVFHPLMCEGNLALNKYRNFVDKEKVYEGRERLLFLKTVDKHKKIKFIWVRK